MAGRRVGVRSARWLSRPGQLDCELAGVDIRAELHRHTLVQAWVAVPPAFGVFALGGRRPHPG